VINSNFGFTPLKEVWLGDCYPESFYDHLPNDIADPFRLITEWTKKDLNSVQTFLESRNIIVKRPTFDSIDNYLDANDDLEKPPICPRDHYFVLDKTLYSLHNKSKRDQWHNVMDKYKCDGFDVQSPIDQPINCVHPPAVVRVGRDLFIDVVSHEHVWGFVSEWAVNQAKNYRVNICNTSGHSDGVFCPVASGLIISSHYKTDYSQSFPGWEVLKISDPTLHNNSYTKDWHVNDPNIDNNKTFNKYIQECASSWVGNFKETVYEVNMLVIDQHNVIAMKEYPELSKYLESNGITMHVFDFRTRSFWDGGWHCLTLDIHREDLQTTDLFPCHGENGVYWRLK
jgi:hypothetical protein